MTASEEVTATKPQELTAEGSSPSAFRARLRRLEPPEREPGVDLARGLAVLGMFAAHLVVTASLVWGEPSTWAGIVNGRSSILFATLAGLSLGLADREGRPRTGGPLRTTRRQLVVRAGLVWALGVGLALLDVPVNVILPTYGLLFLICLVYVGRSTRTLVVTAVALAVVMPFVVGVIEVVTAGFRGEIPRGIGIVLGWSYPFPLWAAFPAAGIAAGRLLVATGGRGASGRVTLLAVGVALAAVGYGLIGPIGNGADDDGGAGGWLLSLLGDEPHASGMGEAVGSGGFAIAAIGLCTLVGRTWLRWALWPVRVLGSMPLTAYTGHILIWAVWIGANDTGPSFDPMDDFRALDPFWPMALVVTLFCVVWALLVGRGPLEQVVSRSSSWLARVSGGSPR